MTEPNPAPKIDPDLVAEIDEANDRIDDISLWDGPVFIVFWILMIVVFLQFFSRYVLNSSISWTEEVARYLLIIVTFAGGIICARKNSHIFLDFFHHYLPARASKWLFAVMDVVTVGFFAFAGWTGITLAQRMGTQRMISIDWPRSHVFWIVTVCLFLIAAVTVYRLIKTLRS